MANSKQDVRAQRARERALAAQRQRQRERRSTIIVIALFVAALGIILGVVAWTQRPQPQTATKPAGVQLADEGRSHVPEGSEITYRHSPPASGNHYPRPASWGTVGTADKPLPEGIFVHNLEHGGIVILYNCPQACPELVQQLTALVRSGPKDPKYNETKIVMTPYSKGMQHQIALLAWNWIDELDAFDRDRIVKFYQDHVDKGPEDVP